jgi:hypothetical protein
MNSTPIYRLNAMSIPCVDSFNAPCPSVSSILALGLGALTQLNCLLCDIEQEIVPEEQAVINALKIALGILGVSLIVAPFMLDYKALSPIIVAVVMGAFNFPSLLMNYKLLIGAGLVSCGVGLYLGYNPGAPIPI